MQAPSSGHPPTSAPPKEASVETACSDVLERLERTTSYIADTQTANGAIPWFEGSITDPWDHVEAAMGLTVGGETARAELAYRWLSRIQQEDGSWWAAYRGDTPADTSRVETNFVAYLATGIWHHYLSTDNDEFLAEMWPAVNRAIRYVLNWQSDLGEIYWAIDAEKGIDNDALVTGCCSIHKSLDCAIRIADVLSEETGHLASARFRLRHALLHRPDRFDRTWTSKKRYSMDWFYPVLTGLLDKTQSLERLQSRWSEFVIEGYGCRCVSDQPWVTVAETSELAMALCHTNQFQSARTLLNWISRFQHSDGSWWTGFVTRDQVLWPTERPTWTAGAVLLAHDMTYRITPGHRLFSDSGHS